MADIQPFRGVLYNTQQVKADDVLTQPYDKITPEMREKYLKLSPYNLVRIELGKEEAGDTESSEQIHPRPRFLPGLAAAKAFSPRREAGPVLSRTILRRARRLRPANAQSPDRPRAAPSLGRGHRPAP